MILSVTAPISAAIEHTRRILFRPFQVGKWFVLGFCAWLAQLGEGGGCNFSGRIPTRRTFAPTTAPAGGAIPTTPSTFATDVQDAINWLQSNLYWLIPVVIAGLLLILALGALLLWLQSRGRFMLMAGIARNDARVAAPWHEFREHGNSLFVFTLLMQLASAIVILPVLVAAAALAWPDIRAEQFTGRGLAAIVLGGGTLLVLGLIVAITVAIARDFVVPVMYARGVRIREAWSIARRELFSGHAGTIALFYLMRIVLGLGVGIIAAVAMCATCCIAALPYLGTVILLPLVVFDRCYCLAFIEQYGPQWRLFVRPAWPPLCPVCQYDLRFNVSGVCPECGTPVTPPAAKPIVPPHA
ncbi:MAG TPA: hypothetical protein VGM03_22505 [Phycisphaerae bacterium]